MIKLFERFFKKDTHFNYTIAEYLPVKIDRMRSEVSVTEYEANQNEEADEMAIDNIYKRM